MLEIAMRQEVGLRQIWMRKLIGKLTVFIRLNASSSLAASIILLGLHAAMPSIVTVPDANHKKILKALDL